MTSCGVIGSPNRAIANRAKERRDREISPSPSAAEMAQRYAGMRLPVSILFGRGDTILSPRDQGEALAAKLPGARLTLIEGGHMLPLTQPDRTAQFIREAATGALLL